MLPSLHKLSPTGEFYALGFKEAKEWNEQNPQGDTFGHEKIPANCHPDTRNCEPTFRVWVRDEVTGNKGTTNYYVYLAQHLWRWYQDNPTDPNNRQLCWSEDWYLLKAQYGLQGAEPEWVKHLPSYNRVQQLADEKQKYLSDLQDAGSGFNNYSFMKLYDLANVLIGPDGTLMEDGSITNSTDDGWVATFEYEKAWRVARWLLDANVLRVIADHLRPQRAETDDPRQHAWATELLHALMKAVGKRWEGRNADYTELYQVVGSILGTPDLLHGLTEYVHWIAVEQAGVIDEAPWERTPFHILYECAVIAQKYDDWRQAMTLATDGLLETLERVFRPLPGEDTADAGYGFTRRFTSKAMAQRIVWALSNHSSPRVRDRLMRRELLLAMTKFSMLELDQNDPFYEENEEFKQMASAVLTNLQNLSPDASAMVGRLQSEVTSLRQSHRRLRPRPRPRRVG